MANERILVVDDEPHIRFLCEEILTRHGYLPTSTQNARAALDAASNKSFDLLMTDISMPDMDGLQLLRSIREHQADLPAIIITGRGRLDDAIRSLRMGAQGFILKPFTQQVLLQSIQETLAKTYLTKENLRLKLLMPLFEISQDLLMETNPTALFEQIVRVASMETKSDQAVLLAKDDRTSTFEINASLPIITGSEALREINRKLGSKTVEKKAPLIHLEGEARSGGEGEISSDDLRRLSEAGFSSFISIPLLYQGRISAVLNLFKRKGNVPYGQGDIELISILSGQAVVAIQNANLFEELERSHFESVKVLAQAIEAKDLNTSGHCDRMVEYALAVADRLGLSQEEKRHLGYGAALHDIGKIGIHESILNKPGKLTEEEYEAMKAHPGIGAEIIKDIEFLSDVVPLIYSHQERYDGTGYPEGLAGEEIPVGARIIAVLDTFDAMTSNRPYRKALPIEAVFSELRRCRGTQFDPNIVDAFIAIIKEGGLERPAS